MVNAHVAHDCRVGSHTIITNNVMLAGHVTVGDYAYLSGGVGVHQFCRIGSHCMVGGQSHINKDVPPYVTVDGLSTRVVGLNVIGLKRRGFTPDEILQLKQAYRIIYRQGLTWEQVLETLSATFTVGAGSRLLSVPARWPTRLHSRTAHARRRHDPAATTDSRTGIRADRGDGAKIG